MENFASFLFYVLVSNLSPGPNTIISMSNASRYGFKKSIRFNIGIFFGVYIIMALCSIFSMSLYSLMPSIKPIISCIGASYILWLAWKIYKSKPNSDNKTQNHTNSFLYGFLLQFVNPNTIIYSLMTVSTFIVPYYKSVFMLAIFSGILAFIGFTATCCWALFGSIFQKFLSKNNKVVNIVMSLLLVYCAVSLFF